MDGWESREAYSVQCNEIGVESQGWMEGWQLANGRRDPLHFLLDQGRGTPQSSGAWRTTGFVQSAFVLVRTCTQQAVLKKLNEMTGVLSKIHIGSQERRRSNRSGSLGRGALGALASSVTASLDTCSR